MIEVTFTQAVIAGLVAGIGFIAVWCIVAAASRGDEPTPDNPSGFYMTAYGTTATPIDDEVRS